MSVHRDARERWLPWLHVVTLCGAPAFCGTALVWGPVRAGVLAVAAALVVAIIGLVNVLFIDEHHSHPLRASSQRRRDIGWWCHVAAASGAVMLILALASMLAPSGALLALVALLVTIPPARTWVRSQFSNHVRNRPDAHLQDLPAPTQPSCAPVDVHDSPVRTVDLDTAELCHLWRVTFWMVRDLRAPARTLHLIELRQEVLDELERRHPDAIGLWLSSGRHCADGPARYL